MDTAVMMPAAIGTICFFILPFLLNVVTVIVFLFIMVGFLSLIKISGYWLLWSCFYRLAGFIKSPTIFLFGMAVSVFSCFGLAAIISLSFCLSLMGWFLSI